MRTMFNGCWLDYSFEEDLQQPNWNDEYEVSSWFMKALSKIDPQDMPAVEGTGGDPTFDANRFAAESRRFNELSRRLWAQKYNK